MIRAPLYIMFAEMGFKIGAEIGVQRGLNALNMFEHIPGLELLMVDPWRGRSKKHYKSVMKAMKPYGDKARIIRKGSIEVSQLIGNGTLDFVYIDALHDYHNFMTDLLLWEPKVKAGGIVSGHDYHHRRKYKNIGVKYAVNDYVWYYNIDLKFSEGRNWYWEKK